MHRYHFLNSTVFHFFQFCIQLPVIVGHFVTSCYCRCGMMLRRRFFILWVLELVASYQWHLTINLTIMSSGEAFYCGKTLCFCFWSHETLLKSLKMISFLQGYSDYHYRELRYQLFCRFCHFLYPGSYGLEEGSARGSGGRHRYILFSLSCYFSLF